jgi:6-pyruvoyltetrahydropterin/6-carboxytetrahydropterin synthase
MWILSKQFKFEAAHYLPNHDGQCRRLHGHSWVGYVYIQGTSLHTDGAKQGMLMDFSDVKKVLKPIVDNYLDHWYLNETTGLLNPTSECLAQWIYNKIKPDLNELIAVRIDETCTSSCIYAPGFDPSSSLSFTGNAIDMG